MADMLLRESLFHSSYGISREWAGLGAMTNTQEPDTFIEISEL